MYNEQLYTAVRFFRHRGPEVMKRNLTWDKLQEFLEEHPTKKAKRTGHFNSFVGFRKD